LKRSILLSVISILFALVLFMTAGCGETAPPEEAGPEEKPERAEYSPGTTEGPTFVSEWLGITLTLPDGASFADTSRIEKETSGTGIVPAASEGASPAETPVCDLMVLDSAGNVCLLLVETDTFGAYGVKLSAEDYAKVLMREMGMEESGEAPEEKVIAGIPFIFLKGRDSGEVYTRFLVGEHEGITVTIILCSHEKQNPRAETVLDAIKASAGTEESSTDSTAE